ncbi:hypothetical protein ACFP2T_13505 [Plantactinospora solaniradicis]|uniref:Uncharacterized protein n=1 Tax=Plantactinospora solaniradicis TaxID=1723736 RepID=A0ABW1K6K2_9ACTN
MPRGTQNQNATQTEAPATPPETPNPAADPTPPGTPPAAPEQTASRAAARRRDAYEDVKPADRNMVDALLVERNGYVQRGDQADRVKQVDEQLKLRGYRTA